MPTPFDKSSSLFPFKRDFVFLNSCGVSPLFKGALDAEINFATAHSERGNMMFARFRDLPKRFRAGLATLLASTPDNISFVRNAAEGLSMLANGYPFEAGDEVISYIHEYPSNHFPWKIQEQRGVTLKLLSDCDPDGVLPAGRPRGWSFDELESMLTPKTRIIALSHVQFTSGFTADLERLGALCRDRGIDLVIDAAQSLGALPIYPERWNIAAVVSSGWKWLLGPVGCGVMYTSPAFRSKIRLTMVGPDMMRQTKEEAYLDHRWNPWESGERFEYSTVPYSLVAGLTACFEEIFVRYPIEEIRNEIFRLQDLFLAHLDAPGVTPIRWKGPSRSGILSLSTERPLALMQEMNARNITVTCRGDYLRIAPHYYIDDQEIIRAAETMNEVARNAKTA